METRAEQIQAWASRKRPLQPFGEGRADGAAYMYGVVSLILIFGLFAIDSSAAEFAISLAILALGAMIGWALAIVVAPYDPSEEKRIAAVVGAVSAIVTGYVLGKTNGLVEHVLQPGLWDQLKPLHVFRIVGFLVELSGTFLYLYSVREYYDKLWLAGSTTKLLVDQLPDEVKVDLIQSLRPEALPDGLRDDLRRRLEASRG